MAFSGSDYKKFPLARDLADRLARRLALLSTAMVVLQSEDSYGNPVLTLQPSGSFSWATGDQYAILRVLPWGSQLNTDAFGNTQTVYDPFRIQIGVEGNTAGSGSPEPSSSDFNSVLGWALELNMYLEVLKDGTIIEVWNSGHGTQPAVSSATALNGTLEASVYSDLFGMINASM